MRSCRSTTRRGRISARIRWRRATSSQLSLYEITNGQHFDAFLSVAGFDTRFVPVHYYNIQALNLMWNHLKNGAPLPPSQVVHTIAARRHAGRGARADDGESAGDFGRIRARMRSRRRAARSNVPN